jgi:hypothetical protein
MFKIQNVKKDASVWNIPNLPPFTFHFLYDISVLYIPMADGERHSYDLSIEKTFVIYDPEKTGYEKMCLCEYLRELPEVSPEEIKEYPENKKIER